MVNYFVSVLLSASIKRFSTVCHMQDCLKILSSPWSDILPPFTRERRAERSPKIKSCRLAPILLLLRVAYSSPDICHTPVTGLTLLAGHIDVRVLYINQAFSHYPEYTANWGNLMKGSHEYQNTGNPGCFPPLFLAVLDCCLLSSYDII